MKKEPRKLAPILAATFAAIAFPIFGVAAFVLKNSGEPTSPPKKIENAASLVIK